MSRSWPYLLLVLAACRPSSTTGTTEGAPSSSASAAPSPSASSPPPKPTREFASGGVITLEVQKYLPLEYMAHGTWAAFSPKGEHAIVGAPGRGSLFPGDKAIGGSEPSNASFTNDGKRFFVVRQGATSSSNEVTIHATSDLRVITKLANAFDPRWIDDDVVFDRDGQVFRLTGNETKLIGPPKPAFRERPRAVVVAPNLESMIVVDQLDRHVSGVRRVALTASGHDALLVSSEVLAKFSKSAEPIAVVAPDASRVCVVGPIRSETAIWCASDDTPAEQIVSFVDSSKLYAASFVGPNILSYRLPTAGAVGISDFNARTASTLSIPGGTTTTDLTPLPGGRLAVARDFYRLGIVDLAARKFTPLGDDSATPKAVAGVGTDDTVFAVTGSSLEAGLGIFRIVVK